MKKLATISPFLLLLAPVFIMILLTFAASVSDHQTDDVALKTPVSKEAFIKIVNPFSK